MSFIWSVVLLPFLISCSMKVFPKLCKHFIFSSYIMDTKFVEAERNCSEWKYVWRIQLINLLSPKKVDIFISLWQKGFYTKCLSVLSIFLSYSKHVHLWTNNGWRKDSMTNKDGLLDNMEEKYFYCVVRLWVYEMKEDNQWLKNN